jgi:hypothetical protein
MTAISFSGRSPLRGLIVRKWMEATVKRARIVRPSPRGSDLPGPVARENQAGKEDQQ